MGEGERGRGKGKRGRGRITSAQEEDEQRDVDAHPDHAEHDDELGPERQVAAPAPAAAAAAAVAPAFEAFPGAAAFGVADREGCEVHVLTCWWVVGWSGDFLGSSSKPPRLDRVRARPVR